MAKPLVVILMGSKGDLEHCQRIGEACESYGLEAVMRIGSAHKTPGHVADLLKEYEADPRPKVYITVAGRSNALSGFTDGAVSAPVIACPPSSDAFGGADLFSSLRMPSGIAPAVVLEPSNAALLAAKILGLVDARVRKAVAGSRERAAEKIIQDDRGMQ
ncbi:MAG TPA: AIR carboxylase family protein [Anaerolineales bacterium]|nr:AIR carboxylase family protein [Anaerolineales bacterium]